MGFSYLTVLLVGDVFAALWPQHGNNPFAFHPFMAFSQKTRDIMNKSNLMLCSLGQPNF